MFWKSNTYNKDLNRLSKRLKKKEINQDEFNREKLILGKNYNIISNEEFTEQSMKLDIEIVNQSYSHDEETKSLKLLEIQKNYSKISDYEFEIKSLDTKYSWVNENDPMFSEYQKKKLQVMLNHGKIDQFEYETSLNDIIFKKDAKKHKMAELDIYYQHGKMTEHEYKKFRFQELGLPYFYIKNTFFDPEAKAPNLEMEFDYNDKFIDFLREQGFSGKSDEHIVDEWFTQLITESAMMGSMMTPAEIMEENIRNQLINSENPYSTNPTSYVNRSKTDVEGITAYS